MKKLCVLLSFCLIFFAAHAERFYWDYPQKLSSVEAQFPVVISDGSEALCFFEEVVHAKTGNAFWVSCMRFSGEAWSKSERIAGPFPYTGSLPDSFSVARNGNTVVLAVTASIENEQAEHNKTVRLYTSHDAARTFFESALLVQEQTVVGPRVFATHDGGFMLFASLGSRELASDSEQRQYERFSFSLIASRSFDGEQWSALEPFAPAQALSNPFSPFLCATEQGDVVVFQAQYESERLPHVSNQLYVTRSSPAAAWSPAVLLTDERTLPPSSGNRFSQYHNQRPFVYALGGRLYVAWERMYYTAHSADIWCAELDETCAVKGLAEQVSLNATAHRPILFGYNERLFALWFDAHTGTDSPCTAEKKGMFWQENPFAIPADSAMQRFAYPVITENALSFLWQQQENASSPAYIYTLTSDTTVSAPKLSAVSFTAGKRSTAERVRAQIAFPEDSSGIAGYSWIWTRNKDEEPPETMQRMTDTTALSARATADGIWYFKARVVDFAGNWSKSAALSYYLDLTPPRPPVIAPPAKDEFGFIKDNEFALNWAADTRDDDVAGYSWSLTYLAPIEQSLCTNSRHPIAVSGAAAKKAVLQALASQKNALRSVPRPAPRIQGTNRSASYQNKTNGVYAFSVCAVDTVGNIGKAAVIPLVLNKYEPETSIIAVHASADTFGTLDVTIVGRGFLYDGTVSEVYFDRDGELPYDITVQLSDNSYQVDSDEMIRSLKLENADAGTYRIGLFHSDRGLYFSDKTLKIDEYGTVKLETPYRYSPDWQPVSAVARPLVRPVPLLALLSCALAVLVLAVSLRGITGTLRESALVRNEVRLLLRGGMMPHERTQRVVAVRKRRGSLKVKFSIFTTQGIFVVVALVAIPLGFMMTRAQSRTLASGLEQRVSVLLDSIASSVRMYLPAQNDLELSALPNLSASLSEASHITIVGLPRTLKNSNLNYVWATNDDKILEHIDSDTYMQGSSRITDPEIATVLSYFGALNEEAMLSTGDLMQRINELTAEGAALALKNDVASSQRRNEINDEVRLLSNRSTEILNKLSTAASGSVPAFDTEHLDFAHTDYLFYKPVLYRQGNEPMYVRAVIFIKISTAELIRNVTNSNKTIAFVSLIIAILVAGIGIVSALIFVSLLVRPIKQLVEHVEMISQTRNKESLAGQEIDIRSKDEIGLLGETVNEMTRNLVKAALDEKLLMDGKSVQQAFIPLLTDASGNKKTTASLNDVAVQLFGYYEGASGVSGDYFDYKKLDDNWYCIIKCDASGHGVPAALIMTVVATMFRQYFESWSWRINGTALDKLVTSINDFIESLGLRGKFTTLMVCLVETQTGDVYICNAGDNLVRYYDSSEKQLKTVALSQTPAAGSLPSFMVDMKGGFTVEKVHLDPNDVLFLYTDGIEESTRKFRDTHFNVIRYTAGTKIGEDSEQLSNERIKAIVEAVFERRTYRLEKLHNPLVNEELLFDFSECSGTVEDAVLALAAVEKVFRMVKSPACTDLDAVRVDRNIDSFLKRHFNQYEVYCARQNDSGEANYIYYTNLREDEQLDDLTLLAVKKL